MSSTSLQYESKDSHATREGPQIDLAEPALVGHVQEPLYLIPLRDGVLVAEL